MNGFILLADGTVHCIVVKGVVRDGFIVGADGQVSLVEVMHVVVHETARLAQPVAATTVPTHVIAATRRLELCSS